MANINASDLNLLKIFHALQTHNSVSQAAMAVGLSQPAMSHALARLRDLYNDQLFVRVPGGVTPTPKAQQLAPEIEQILASIERTLSEQKFLPEHAEDVFTIGGTDYLDQILFSRLIPVLMEKAPGIRLISRQIKATLPKKELESGQLDLAIAGFFDDLPEGFYNQRLFDDTFACLVRKNHPIIGDKITLKQFTEMKHILISPSGVLEGVIDEALQEKGLKRHVIASFPSFQASGWILAESDVILTAPARLVESFIKYLPVKVIPSPVKTSGFTVKQVWHQKMHSHPAHRFIRQEIFKIAQQL